MSYPIITNRTDMTDWVHFIKLVRFTYESILIVRKGGTYEDICEALDELEIKNSNHDGFLTSSKEFFISLEKENRKGDYFKYRIGSYINANFKPEGFFYLNNKQVERCKENLFEESKSVLNSCDGWVHATDSFQACLAGMSLALEYPKLFKGKYVEYDYIARSELEFQIAYIQLSYVHKKYRLSCNLFLIEGESFNTNDATLIERIGTEGNVYELSCIKDKKSNHKNAA